MEDLCIKMQSDELGNSKVVRQNIDKMFELISGKYFNKKEQILDSFSKIMDLMEKKSPWLTDAQFQ